MLIDCGWWAGVQADTILAGPSQSGPPPAIYAGNPNIQLTDFIGWSISGRLDSSQFLSLHPLKQLKP